MPPLNTTVEASIDVGWRPPAMMSIRKPVVENRKKMASASRMRAGQDNSAITA
jgi:hypothetical protein